MKYVFLVLASLAILAYGESLMAQGRPGTGASPPPRPPRPAVGPPGAPLGPPPWAQPPTGPGAGPPPPTGPGVKPPLRPGKPPWVAGPNRPGQGGGRDLHRRLRRGNYSVGWAPSYGLTASYGSNLGDIYGPQFGFRGQGSVSRENLRFVNVFELGTVDNRGDYRLRLYYDSLDQKNFPAVLDELATGILGAVAYWRSERPTLVAHSAALEKFFDFLDKKIVATLRGTDHLTDGQRISLAFKLVRDNLSPLVDSVSVNGGEYMVRFKTRTGSRSPWVLVPVVFGYADLPSSGKMASGQAAMVANPAFGGTGGFKTAGPFYYYRGADSEASLEPAKLGYDPENLYWKY